MAKKYRISTYSNPHTAKDGRIEIFEKGLANITKKADRIRYYRKEVSKLASIANKRIQRLEVNDLTNNPAYQRYIKEGGKKFGVKGKSFNEVQAELAKLRNFISSKTSTIRGTNEVLKEIASNTGIKYKNLSELRNKSAKFFELSSKVEQYLRQVEDKASAIGYQQIWEAINEYTNKTGANLSDSNLDVDGMVERISEALDTYEEPVEFVSGWYSLKDDDLDNGKF